MRVKTPEQFVSDAIRIHGSTYDYSKTEYISARKKVCVICREHGQFDVLPDNHLRRKTGCPKCANFSSYWGSYEPEGSMKRSVQDPLER